MIILSEPELVLWNCQNMDDESDRLTEIAALNNAKEVVFKLQKDDRYGR